MKKRHNDGLRPSCLETIRHCFLKNKQKYSLIQWPSTDDSDSNYQEDTVLGNVMHNFSTNMSI